VIPERCSSVKSNLSTGKPSSAFPTIPETLEGLSIWNDNLRTRLMALYIPPADALRSYWTPYRSKDHARELSAAIERGHAPHDQGEA
jgi:hypothetical protein